jgi:regulator of RNase E activity RraB
MSLVDSLLSTAQADTELLIQNDRLGDDFSIPRDVDFLIKTSDEETAKTIASFVADNQYGQTRVERIEDGFRVSVLVRMPITQPVICSVSALMVCLAHLFNADYDGWGCVIQNRAEP